MTRAKRPPGPSFTGLLNKPIDVGPYGAVVSDLLYPDDTEKRLRKRSVQLMLARFKKLDLLIKHYSIDKYADDALSRFFLLAMSLATDFVPGFWDAEAPNTPRPRGRAKGVPLVWLRMVVDGMKNLGTFATDAEACEFVATLFEPNLNKPSQKTALKKRGRTFANRLAVARRIHEK